MPRMNYSPSAGSTIVDKLKIYEGGTGDTRTSTIRSNLQLVPNIGVNAANGVAGLDTDGKLLVSVFGDDGASPISLVGPKSVAVSTTSVYQMTNFDLFTEYKLEPIGEGKVSRQGNLISYVAPATPGIAGFKINGRECEVTITLVRPDAPAITPVARFGGTGKVVLQCSGTNFNVSAVGRRHDKSDWQISTDADFSNVVSQSLQDKVNLKSWTSGPVDLSTSYYLRLRYYDNTGVPSEWSSVTMYTTGANYVVSSEEFKAVPADLATGNHFGGAVCLTADGDRAFFTARFQRQANNGFGTVYVYFRNSSGLWNLEQKLAPNDLAEDNFGCTVGVDETGTRAIVGAYEKAGGGAAYIFIRNGTFWSQEAKLLGTGTVNGDNFGAVASISADGLRAVVGARLMGGNGAAFVYTRTGTSWSVEKKLSSSDLAAGDQFGSAMSIDGTGQRVVVAAYQKNNKAGAVYVFLRTAAADWVQEAKLLSSDIAANDQFGWTVFLSKDGDRIIAGSPTKKTSTGAVYIFKRVNNAWGQEVKLEIASSPTGMLFGTYCGMNYSGDLVTISEENGTGIPGSTATQPGNIYIFTRLNNLWRLEKKIGASDGASGDKFGIGNAVSGYGNRVIVGAYPKSGSASQTGAGYIYS